MGNFISNNFPPTAPLTEKNLPDQTGKVLLVTGAASGIGAELAKILYGHNAKVYIAGRSAAKGASTIAALQAAHPHSKGSLVFLHLDLNDLTTIKASAEEVLSAETRLDVLFLNAGVMVPPQGSKTAQGYELQLGTNNIAHFLLVQLLRPLLVKTARKSPRNSVRVVWVSSSMAELAPKGLIDFDNMDFAKDEAAWTKYARSKAGNALHAAEFARRTEEEGILSVSLNPGNLKTPLQRHVGGLTMLFLGWILYEPIFGAYTELFAGFSPDLEKHNGGFIQPWGRMVKGRKEFSDPIIAKRYWEWTEAQTDSYL